MKLLVFTLLILLTICSSAFSQNRTALDEFKSFWEIFDKSLRNPQTTPLLPNDLANFQGLSCFAFDENYRVKADLLKSTERKSFLMPISTGGSRKYLKIGDLRFKLNGKEFSLSAFVHESKAQEEVSDLFVPFKDLTNSSETYSAGRYLYLRIPKEGEKAVLDFNLSFNPNCAYNPNFVCTLPPKENSLQAEIKAGEKKFISLSQKQRNNKSAETRTK